MKYKYMALDVAFYIIEYCNKNDINIYNSNLQEILYYTQGYHLVEYEISLFKDEIFAFDCGPIVYNVYTYFAPYRYNRLDCKKKFEGLKELDRNTKEWINNILENKLKIKSIEVLGRAKEKDPWLITTNNGLNLNKIIKPEIIKNYFK